jgi:predicted CoA-binding protein
MAFENPPDDAIRALLSRRLRIAVIGCSPDPLRDSHLIAGMLVERGHDVVPVNPRASEVFGRRCYASLREVPGKVDLVDVFRPSSEVAEIVEQAIEKRVEAVWTQLGIADEQAAARARAAGLTVVMNRCPAIEYRRLFREVHP